MPRFTKETAQKYGAKGGRTVRRITLARAQRELGTLKTPDDAKARLDKIMMWGAAGLVPGTVVNGIVRGVEVWLAAEAQKADFEAVEELRQKLEQVTRDRDRLLRERQGRAS